MVPVLGQLDVTTEELAGAAIQAVRLAAVTLAFAVYALLLDHDSLLSLGEVRAALGSRRRARDEARADARARRPRARRGAARTGGGGEGVRGRARLVSPLVSGSLERALNLAEAMEARGYGRAGATQGAVAALAVARPAGARRRGRRRGGSGVAVATARGLSFSYGDGGADGPALADVSLDIAPGEIVLLAGRSGCGKTTLIRALAGLVPHFHGGPLRRQGRDRRPRHATTRPAELAGTVRRSSRIPEDQVVFGGVLAEVSFGIENAGAPSARDRAACTGGARRRWAPRTWRSARVAELSGGELQRVCLASTLALEPALLLLDEPTSQLDAEGATALIALVRRLARERGTAVVISEHRVARTALYCDRVDPSSAAGRLPPFQRGAGRRRGKRV